MFEPPFFAHSRQVFLAFIVFVLFVFSVLSGADSLSLLNNWISGGLPLMFLAMSASIVISSGNVDISSGAVLSFIGMIIIFLISLQGASVPIVLISHVLGLTFALGLYMVYFLCVRSNMAALIVTLAFLFICRGLSVLLQACMQGVGALCRSVDRSSAFTASGILPEEYTFSVVNTSIVSSTIALALVGSLYFWRFHTRSGLEHVAVGQDLDAAEYADISVDRVYLRAFLIAGCLVCAAAYIRLHGPNNGGWSANTGWGEELLAIAIAVIGGTRITGGRLDPIAVALAAMLVYGMRDVVTNDLALPSELAAVAFGAVMVMVIWLDAKHDLRRKR